MLSARDMACKCAVRIALGRVARPGDRTMGAIEGTIGSSVIAMRGTDFMGCHAVLVIDTETGEMDLSTDGMDLLEGGDPLQAFASFVGDGDCQIDLAVLIPEGSQPPEGAFPVDQCGWAFEFVPGMTAYAFDDVSERGPPMSPSFHGCPVPSSGLRLSLLPPRLRGPCQELVDSLYERDRSVELRGVRMEDMGPLYDAMFYDHPMLFDVTHFRYCIRGSSATIVPVYGMSEVATEMYRSRAMERLDEARSIMSGMSGYEIEVAIHDMLVNSVRYRLDAPDGRIMLGPLLNGRGICGGISLAASFLLNGTGVESGVATGTALDGTPHAWNMVRLDGTWYHVDVTWDLSEYGGHVKHDYLNVSDSFMRRSRSWGSLPEAPGMERNYHTMDGVVVYRIRDLPAIFRRLVAQRRSKIEIRISDSLIGEYDPSRGASSLARELSRVGGRYSSAFNPVTGCQVFDVVYA